MTIISDLNINATFWLNRDTLPSIDAQYYDLWRFAKTLDEIGISIDEWYPPAATPEQSLLNKAFDENGVTTAALAIANTSEKDPSLRFISVWNGRDEIGGAILETKINLHNRPGTFKFAGREIVATKNKNNALKMIRSVIEIWNPILVEVSPYHYKVDYKVFKDRPGVGWMIYLPLSITPAQVPEAEELIPIFDEKKQQKGTLLISTKEVFDINNKEHIKRANAIEVRLADQDLLPKRMDFLKIR